jgi:hypothetical protein
MGTQSLLGVKQPECGIGHPPPSSTQVQARIELYLYSPSGPSWPLIEQTFLLYKHNHVIFILAEGDVSVQGCLPALVLPSSAVGLVAVVVGQVAYLAGPSGAVVAAAVG